jgi:hypothetical protein
MYPLSRADDPETWSKLVNSDGWVVTQVDNGEVEEGRGIVPTRSASAPVLVGARLPGWCTRCRNEHDGPILMMSHFASGSWATILPGEGKHRVYHQGPRRLWEELEAAYQWWTDAGRPHHTRFGLSVTPKGRRSGWTLPTRLSRDGRPHPRFSSRRSSGGNQLNTIFSRCDGPLFA